jgi:hypothetical protein
LTNREEIDYITIKIIKVIKMAKKTTKKFNSTNVAPYVGQISESLPKKTTKNHGSTAPDGQPWRRVFKDLEDAKQNSHAFAHLRND